MKEKTILPALLSLVFVCAAVGQTTALQGIEIDKHQVVKDSDQVNVRFHVSFDELHLKRNDMVVLTPVLKSNQNNMDSITLTPIVVTGKIRGKVLNRQFVLGNETLLTHEPEILLRRRNNTPQSVNYQAQAPYSQWMQDASLIVVEEIWGCAECRRFEDGLVITQDILTHRSYTPDYHLTHIVPPEESLTKQEHRQVATFNYPVGQYTLLHDYKNNAKEFDRLHDIVSGIQNNTGMAISGLTVTGYASPEGPAEYNRYLSEQRAGSFVRYLSTKYTIAPTRIQVIGYGEDWNTVRKQVENSFLAYKDDILRIMDDTADPDARDALLAKLPEATYRTLLRQYYPPVRRIEFTIAYEKEPDPDDAIVILHTAIADIEDGNNQAAIDRLSKIENDPRAWNSLGVAYARLDHLQKAEGYFQKAAARGDEEARINLQQLKGMMEDRADE